MPVPEPEQDFEVWNVRLRTGMAKQIDQLIEKKSFASRAEFIRAALREKMERLGVEPNEIPE